VGLTVFISQFCSPEFSDVGEPLLFAVVCMSSTSSLNAARSAADGIMDQMPRITLRRNRLRIDLLLGIMRHLPLLYQDHLLDGAKPPGEIDSVHLIPFLSHLHRFLTLQRGRVRFRRCLIDQGLRYPRRPHPYSDLTHLNLAPFMAVRCACKL